MYKLRKERERLRKRNRKREDRSAMTAEIRREIEWLAMIKELDLIEIAKVYRITLARAYRVAYMRNWNPTFRFSRN
jgi:hypothetical protein